MMTMKSSRKFIWAVTAALVLAFSAPAAAQFSAQIQQFWNQLSTGAIAFITGRVQTNGYFNYGNVVGSGGYGFRDNSGTMQVKNSGGSWADILYSGGSIPAPGSDKQVLFNNAGTIAGAASLTYNTATGQTLLANGSVSAPSIAFATHTNDGIYSAGAGTVSISASGNHVADFTTGGVDILRDSGRISLGAATDVILTRDAANTLALRNGTNAQRFNVANTWTSPSSNEYFSVDWQSVPGLVSVGSRTASTGTRRGMLLAAQDSNGANAYAGALLQGGVPYIAMGRVNGGGNGLSEALTGNMIELGRVTNTTTSGSFAAVAITPTYNEASGSAANTDFLIKRTETAIGSGAQLFIDAQIGTSSRWNVDRTGAQTVSGANGQAFSNVQSLTELTTIAAAATTDTTIQMPANAVILGVSVRVTTVIPTATSFSVGDSGSATRFSTANVSTAANSTDPGTKAGAYYNASATSVRLTMNGGVPADNTGRVRVTIYYYSVTPPTS